MSLLRQFHQVSAYYRHERPELERQILRQKNMLNPRKMVLVEGFNWVVCGGFRPEMAENAFLRAGKRRALDLSVEINAAVARNRIPFADVSYRDLDAQMKRVIAWKIPGNVKDTRHVAAEIETLVAFWDRLGWFRDFDWCVQSCLLTGNGRAALEIFQDLNGLQDYSAFMNRPRGLGVKWRDAPAPVRPGMLAPA